MKLFIKIFLWFLVTIAMTIGVVLFITRTFQTDPMSNRMQRSLRNQMTIYSGTATQIAAAEGESGLRNFLSRLRDVEPPRKVDLVDSTGNFFFGDPAQMADTSNIVSRAIASGELQVDSGEERALGAAPVDFPDGRRLALVIQWDRQAPPPLFFGSSQAHMRLAGLLATGLVFCTILALYLSSPIRKLREATNRLAAGDLSTRVGGRVGKRRDEIADLARDFDEMAERIGSLITNQQRLNRDISHELRSPLARLNVALEIAKQRSNPETLAIIGRMESESTRLNDMISRILTLSKLESGSVDYERTPLDLTELVNDVAADANFEATANGRSVKVSADESISVEGSEMLLRSAIENVLRNAVRYTPEGTSVSVSLIRSNGTAVLTITDEGGGVPDEDIEHMFRPFYRIGDARERKTGGSGLGLAIAQRAIEAHKGTITAENLNGGLKVEIKIAAAASRKTAAA
jgi:signal transduction histidine kinase